MKSFKKGAKIALVILIVAMLVGQLIRLEKSNPPARADSSIDVTVRPLLKRACYDCHSNETVWPWYSSVAPVSWLVASDVKEGRREVNFSEWESYPVDEQSHLRKHIAEEVEEGAMPPWYYLMIHRESRLEPAERDKIRSWTAVASRPAESK